MLVAVLVAEGVAIALLALVVAGLLRSHGEVLRTLHRIGAGVDPDRRVAAVDVGPPAGEPVASARQPVTPAPAVVGVTLDDEAVSWPVATTGGDTLLAFLSSGCETCLPFWRAFAAPVDVPGGAELLIVTGGPERESETLLRQLAPPDVPLVMSSEAWDAYSVPGSPHFVYVDGESGLVVGEGSAPSWPQAVSLLERASGDRRTARRRAHPARAHVDNDAPDRVDAELRAAGITPGHPSLYADPVEGPA